MESGAALSFPGAVPGLAYHSSEGPQSSAFLFMKNHLVSCFRFFYRLDLTL